MTEPCILVTKPKSISNAGKKLLRQAGVTVVETEDPQSVRFLRPGIEMDSLDLLGCAMRAIKRCDDRNTQKAFADMFADLVQQQLKP